MKTMSQKQSQNLAAIVFATTLTISSASAFAGGSHDHKHAVEYNPVKNEFGMYHENQWYALEFISLKMSNNFIDTLDINILNNFCFTKILNIKDVNNDERIRFIAGCHGLGALEKKVNDNPDSVAFSIFPSEITDVIKVADNNLTMPPKSTWFDPKPLDGLVVYEFE